MDVANVTAFGTSTPWRILAGNAYNGSANSIYSGTSPGTITSATNAPRLLVSDIVSYPNTGARFAELTSMAWIVPTANISNNSSRISASRSELMVGGNTSNFAFTGTSPFLAICTSSQVYVGRGTNANLSGVGNTAISGGVVGIFNGVTIQAGSNVVYATGHYASISAVDSSGTTWGNITHQVGHVVAFGGSPANANITATTTACGYYMPPNNSTGIYGSGITMGNIARMSTNYHAFRNDDTLAKSRLGSLETFNEYTANVTSSSGSVAVNKSLGQVQQLYLTENVTTITFSNFVTRVLRPNNSYVNQSDTVTLILQQGATPYTVTMPTGTAYRYAGGGSTVSSTANTTVMISITGTYNYNTAADQYLITISPGFA